MTMFSFIFPNIFIPVIRRGDAAVEDQAAKRGVLVKAETLA